MLGLAKRVGARILLTSTSEVYVCACQALSEIEEGELSDASSTNLKEDGSSPSLTLIRKQGWYSDKFSYLKGKVPSSIGIPTSVALPFGVFEKVLLDDSNQVKRRIDLVYGGGSVGLMGLISQAVYDGGCHVLGSLSEFGVLGFELGYSMENPNSLVVWEAQFGDFSNGAQVMFDQFLSSGESKWLRQTGLVVLLPHGYDGQGPEHSSARLERFLQMSDDNPYVIPEMDPTLRTQIQECNWQVVNVTTPANYFHVLRRQIHREFRKPLIVMAPKNLLRHKDCKSNLSEFDDVQGHPGFDKQGTRFKRLIKDQNDHSDLEEGIRRLVLCSGKVYYEIDEERKKADAKDVAICRVEQLCPFPYDLVQRELKRYPKAEVVWCQEEPMNMGGYTYIAPRLCTAMKALGRGTMDDIKYVGRAPSAATATGFYSVHMQEQTDLIQKAIQRDPINPSS